jgi:hypothetical protein
VSEGLEVLDALNEIITDKAGRPLQNSEFLNTPVIPPCCAQWSEGLGALNEVITGRAGRCRAQDPTPVNKPPGARR